MFASRSALASLELDAPVRHFKEHQAAVQAIARYERALFESASRMRSSGLNVTDQAHPDEVFCLSPEHASAPPVAIVGGMGPLAGAIAFRRACGRFRNSRRVVLHQACSLPDRTGVILRESSPDTRACREMASRLAGAVRQAATLAAVAGQPARCLIACNSAHYFWRLVKEDLGEYQVHLISLVESSVEAFHRQPCRNALLLATEGARAGQVFSAPFREASIAFEEPRRALSGILMGAIFEGVKALDDSRAVELGNEFFETILRTGPNYDCVVAGCTELPLLIDLLRLRGSPGVAAYLSRVRIVDPLEEALCRV